MFVFSVYRLSFISHLTPLNSFFKKAAIFENTVISLPTYFLPLTKPRKFSIIKFGNHFKTASYLRLQR